MDNICSADEVQYVSGPGKGSRVIQIRNDRLRFEVLPDRGMNIGQLEYQGIPFAWISTVGSMSPHFYDPAGYGWLRTFSGGALVTCGLTQVGDPCEENGERLGLHGRISQIPAFDVGVQREWQGSDYVISVRGVMRETKVFGEFLELSRTITTSLGSAKIHIHDEVTNQGHQPSPFMLLYHMNFGYPLVSPRSKIIIPSLNVHPYDEAAAQYLETQNVPSQPYPGEAERVYYHDMAAETNSQTFAAIVNHDLDHGLGVLIEWNKQDLPQFVQWNMFASGQYVVGLEPGNCITEGRVAEKQRGTLQYLEPGESRNIDLVITIVHNASDLKMLEERCSRIIK